MQGGNIPRRPSFTICPVSAISRSSRVAVWTHRRDKQILSRRHLAFPRFLVQGTVLLSVLPLCFNSNLNYSQISCFLNYNHLWFLFVPFWKTVLTN